MYVVGRIPQTPILNSVSGRRRKIRCTFNPDRPEACNECRLRGSTCIDQEHDSDKPKASDAAQGDQRYSLRERVAHLENIVEDLAKRLNETSPVHSRSEFCELPTACAVLFSRYLRLLTVYSAETLYRKPDASVR